MGNTKTGKMNSEGLLVVICGPSGAGKGTIYHTVLERLPLIKRSVSVTTRKPRKGEEEGVHYHFKTLEEYQNMIASGEFLETASVFDNYYGTPKTQVLQMIKCGHDVMFEIDVVGARQIKAKYADSVLIFVMPPDFDELENRLRNRGTESDEVVRRRLLGARMELAQYEMFDYFVINDRLDDAVDAVISIIMSEKHKIKRNKGLIKSILAKDLSTQMSVETEKVIPQKELKAAQSAQKAVAKTVAKSVAKTEKSAHRTNKKSQKSAAKPAKKTQIKED